jgi:glycerol kinase
MNRALLLNTATTYPRPGWYSQDPNDIVEKSFLSAKGAIAKAGRKKLRKL